MSKLSMRLAWDDDKATAYYVLLKISNMNGYWEEEIARGDLAWADRTTKHYGLKLPNKEEQEWKRTHKS